MDEEKTQIQNEGEQAKESFKDSQGSSNAEKESSREETQRSPIDEAKDVLAEIKRANAETKKLLERQERLAADQLMAGKGFAGQRHTPSKADEAVQFWGDDSPVGSAIRRHPDSISDGNA